MNTEQSTPNPRIASTANALMDLFELSKDKLSDDKLEWYAGLLTPAITEAININSTINQLATAQGSLDKNDLPSPSGLADILFGLADAIDNIKALMCIVEEAHYLAGERRKTLKPG